ncbi:RNA polymerase II transcription factor SIII subunit A-domain-containing protein [Xylariaceae sp. FL1272]|nr:RNA polymerase II transcription factor SIII subunit A-domain-containing protein [Xylariaceae sp. FL1272]
MVKSLVELCTAVCIRNIKEITDVGETPYSLVRPILMRIDDADQLRALERASPHLEEEDAECWQRLIEKHFFKLHKRHKWSPKNPRSWHNIYFKYRREDEELKEAATEKLTAGFRKIKNDKQLNTSKVVNYDSRKLPRLPRDVKTEAGRSRNTGTKIGPDESSLRWTSGSKTKVNTPKGVLKKVMRESKDIATRNRLNNFTPTGKPKVPQNQILRAPEAMIQERINKARPLGGIRPPAPRPLSTLKSQELDDREARLRKAKQASNESCENLIDDDELEEFDLKNEDADANAAEHVGLDADDLEAYFGEAEERAPEPIEQKKPIYHRRGGLFGYNTKKVPVIKRVETITVSAKSSPTPSTASSRKEQPKSSSISPPAPGPAPKTESSPSASTTPASGAPRQRKRKPTVDIFMSRKNQRR